MSWKLPLASALFLFWIVLSGKFDSFHLFLGVLSAAGVTAAVSRVMTFPPAIVPFFGNIAWTRGPFYLAWLAGQIVQSSLQVAYLVLHPRMPISPCLARFKRGLPHPLAHMTLANSITLTPGTVTLDLEDDEYVIHALTESAARALVPENREGEIPRKVAALFGAGPRGKDREASL